METGRYLLFGLAIVLLLALGCTGPEPTPTTTPTPTVPPLMVVELGYWDRTNPLVERAVLDGGTPLASVYLENLSELAAGNPDAWETFVRSTESVLPVYVAVLQAWLSIQPPSAGISGELHTAYGNAWRERITSLQLIIMGWRTNDDSALQEGFARMESASELGQAAESLRREFNTRLFRQCQVHRLLACK